MCIVRANEKANERLQTARRDNTLRPESPLDLLTQLLYNASLRARGWDGVLDRTIECRLARLPRSEPPRFGLAELIVVVVEVAREKIGPDHQAVRRESG